MQKKNISPLKRIWRFMREVRNAVSLVTSDNYRFISFAAPGHFYSPIPDIAAIREYSNSLFDKTIKDIPGVDLNPATQLGMVRHIESHIKKIPYKRNSEDSDTNRYYFNNPYFSYGDAVALYGMMRHFKPKRIIEVGSGYSSAAMLDTFDAFFDDSVHLTFVEPYPDRLNMLLRTGDTAKDQHTILEKPVQQVPLDTFCKLEKNDILFIDSSHVMKAGSDLSFIMNQLLPVLKPGVIIHFHDILWPFEYPRKWFNNGRAWNEAYVLRVFLQHNNAYEILFFNSWLEAHHKALLKRHLPLMLQRPDSKITHSNSSLWLRKK